MLAMLAAAPLAVILIGMGVLGKSAVVVGSVGLALTIGLSLMLFQPVTAPGSDALMLLRGTAAEAAHSTVTILWIILPALAIYEFQKASGAIGRIRDNLTSLTAERRLQTILIAWFFGLFMEGAAGFGTPVALAAPLLVGLGYAPVRAVVLALFGHAAGVSFGAVGTPVLAQVSVTGLDAQEIALRTAALHAVSGPIILLAMVRLADRSPLSRRDVGWTLAAGLCFLLPSLGLAWLTGPELPTLGGALIGAVAFVMLLPRPGRLELNLRQLSQDLAPYAIILALVLLTRLIAPVQGALSAVSMGWSFGGSYSGTFQPLYHPGTMLLLGLVFGSAITRRADLLPGALLAALRRMAPVALALLVMLALSRTMVHSGMIDELAAAAAGVGPLWPVLAPLIGMFGTFITGSATASNILFTELQVTTATQLALSAPLLVAAQGFGAAIGNIVAPHNIIAGSATVGLTGREGEVLRRTVVTCLIYAVLGGIVVLLAST
ncbi:MAG: L-lactate permease [Pseudomonadota bacterium]